MKIALNAIACLLLVVIGLGPRIYGAYLLNKDLEEIEQINKEIRANDKKFAEEIARQNKWLKDKSEEIKNSGKPTRFERQP